MSMTILLMIFSSKINYDQDADIFEGFNIFNLEQKTLNLDLCKSIENQFIINTFQGKLNNLW